MLDESNLEWLDLEDKLTAENAKGCRVYKYMHIYLWSTLCFETQIYADFALAGLL